MRRMGWRQTKGNVRSTGMQKRRWLLDELQVLTMLRSSGGCRKSRVPSTFLLKVG